MEIITTSSRGQIVIPESMRKKHDIKKGTRLVLFDDGDKIIIEREEKIAAILKLNILTEDSGWQKLSEQGFKEVWDNKQDEQVWRKYLKHA